MLRTSRIRFYLLSILFVALTACGGGGGGGAEGTTTTPAATTTITGVVQAPSTTVVQYEDKGALRMMASLFISDLHAAVTGLVAVPDAIVELIRINEDGSPNGLVIETATTNPDGTYSLEFEGTISSDMVVQVRSDIGVPMRALVVSDIADINPVTEYVTQQVLASVQNNDHITLDSISEAAVEEITLLVEELDIAFTGSETIEEIATIIDTAASNGGVDVSAEVNNGLYTVDLNGLTPTSVMTASHCTNGAQGGWEYTFSATGMTLTGSDTFISNGDGNCTRGAEESFTLTHAEVQEINDIPFNCGNDNVCTYDDLNKVIEGTDGDGRAFTSTYTHVPGSNTLTYVKSATDANGTTVYTEIITLVANDNPPNNVAYGCSYESGWNDVAGEPATFNSYTDFLQVVDACGGAQMVTDADVIGTWTASYTFGANTEVDVMTFNADQTLDYTNILDGVVGGTMTLSWSLVNNLVTITAVDFFDVTAITPNGMKVYTEEAGWSSNPNLDTLDGNPEGEIWTSTAVKQQAALSCNTLSGWDDLADEPATFYSYSDYLIVLAECGGALALTNADIEGAWEDVFTLETVTTVFNNDGTFTSTMTDNNTNAVLDSWSGTWSLTNNILRMESGGELEVNALTASGWRSYIEEAGTSVNPDLSTLDGTVEGAIDTPSRTKVVVAP